MNLDEETERLTRERFTGRLAQFGRDPRTLGWGRSLTVDDRLSAFTEEIQRIGADSVLDVGCGYGALASHLGSVHWEGRYHGLDLVPELLELIEPPPGIQVTSSVGSADANLGHLGTFDVAVASGVFNYAVPTGNRAFIADCLREMWSVARRAVIVDFMTTEVDFMHPGSWHTSPTLALSLGAQLPGAAPRLKQEYAQFEYMLIVERR